MRVYLSFSHLSLFSPLSAVPTSEQADERIQRRSTVRLGIRLIHKICPEINLSNEPSQQPTVPRSLRLRLSPKARKLIKQTSLIIHGSNSGTNNSSNGNVKSMVEADVVDGLNRVSIHASFRKVKEGGKIEIPLHMLTRCESMSTMSHVHFKS